jgi:fumarate reductase subunit D
MDTPEALPPTPQDVAPAGITPDPKKPESSTGISEHMLFAALSYVGVLIFIPWLIHRDDPYVQFHLKQGLVILAGFILALLAARWIPVVGNLLFLLLLILDVVALVQALLGRRWKIPFIGQLAEQFRI